MVRSMFVFTAMLIALSGFARASPVAPDVKPKVEPRKAVEGGIRAWYAGMGAPNEEDRLKALEQVLPDKKTIETLFPKHAEKVWPLIEADNQKLRDLVGPLTKQITRH